MDNKKIEKTEQEIDIKDILIWKEEIKVFLLTDDIIVYVENFKLMKRL